jgi:hypothetical protein
MEMTKTEMETVFQYLLEILESKQYDIRNCCVVSVTEMEKIVNRLHVKKFHFKMITRLPKRLSDNGYKLVSNFYATVKIEKINTENLIYFSEEDVPPLDQC